MTSEQKVMVALRDVRRKRLHAQTPLAKDTDIAADLRFDSLKLATLIVEVEDHFKLCAQP